ncbi:MAG: RNase adapter protein RapZ [Bacillota bacterium]|nr:RNase adapter protein RapZ [Bacillota bacterium]MDK2855633.1 RNase adapter protein RapZ [Bacillota bacterium]MDK2925823.1 RNase adapter protein RapZ [Bacillota bacterium]
MPSETQDFVIVTGLSGAGKSSAVRVLEDLGYFCVDNLPPDLAPKFAELCLESQGQVRKVALGIDIRGGGFFDHVFDSLKALEQMGLRYRILFLEASDAALIRRFKETRRRHPLAPEGRVVDGIAAERARMEDLKSRATYIIDTSNMTPAQLKEELRTIFAEGEDLERLLITLVTFGFKQGLPLDADMVFDVRFLPNPYYVEELRPHTGQEEPVRRYVLKWGVTKNFLAKVHNLLEFLIPYFIKEGKTSLVIGIGCTGGRHRSVTIAEELARLLTANKHRVLVQHRDMEKDVGP